MNKNYQYLSDEHAQYIKDIIKEVENRQFSKEMLEKLEREQATILLLSETKEQMEELLQQKQKKARGLSGIGVANVKERLRLYYGSAGRVVCESSEAGTKICLCLPAYREQDRYAL